MTAARCVLIFLKTSGPQYLISITSACHWRDRYYAFLNSLDTTNEKWPLGARQSSARFLVPYYITDNASLDSAQLISELRATHALGKIIWD